MKYLFAVLALGIWTSYLSADVPARVIDGQRTFAGGEKVHMVYNLPCDSVDGVALSANLTPVVVQLVPSMHRKGTLQNSGAVILRYRLSQWGLPSDWATVYNSVPAASSKDVDLSGVQQLWAWSSAAQTPAPSYSGCFAVNAVVAVPTITPTITKTATPTFTPTFTPTITPTATPTATPA